MTVLRAYADNGAISGGHFFPLQAYDFVAPLVFDQSRTMGASIRKSSVRFDRIFGGQREMRIAGLRGVIYTVAPGRSDTEIRSAHPFNDEVAGLGLFLQTLQLAATPDGDSLLPFPQGTRLIAYLKSPKLAMLQVVEAVRCQGAYELDVFDLDEAAPWDLHTHVLDVANRRVG